MSLQSLRITSFFFRLCLLLAFVCAANAGLAQTYEISGIITDSMNSPISQAFIKIKGSVFVSMSRNDGSFVIQSNSTNPTLQVSMVGFEPLNVIVAVGEKQRIVLKNVRRQLDEVVVIGYGTSKKKDLTGSVSSVSSSELMKTNPVTLEQGIQGRAAGVLVTQTDGAPGAGMSIQIRGSNSFLGGTEPLYVIDGVPIESNNAANTPTSGSTVNQATVNTLSFLNPSDIASIEILKDASATAIYGSRGANGVVIITTKKGSLNQNKIDFNLNTCATQITKKYKLLNAEQFAIYQNESYINSDKYLGTTYQSSGQLPYPGALDPFGNYRPGPADYKNKSTDWQGLLYQTAPKQDYTVTFSGGSDKNTYLVSANLLDQSGVIINSKYRRYSIKANIDQQIKSWLQVGSSVNYSNTISNMVSTGASIVGTGGGVVKSVLTFYPTLSLRDTTTDQYSQLASVSNPYAYAKNALDKVTGYRMFSSSYLEATILPILKFRSVFGWNVAYDRRDEYYPSGTNEGASSGGRAYVGTTNTGNVSSENYFTFVKTWGKHYFNAMGGFSYNNGVWQYQNDGASGFMNDALGNNDLGAAAYYVQPTNGKSDWRLLSYYGRVNYIFNQKYLFTATYRRDGSSKFAANNKWAGFTSGAIAWRISEEKFLKNVKWLNNLKARLSYGQSGNQGIGSYSSLSQISASNYPYNGTVANGYLVTSLGNDNLKWETTNQTNVGLDIGIVKDRITIVADYYYKKTKDLLQYLTLPTSTGFASQLTNLGSIQNKGFEAAINGVVVRNKDFSWNLSANISFNKNKILDLGGIAEQWIQTIGTEPVNYQPFVLRVGQPMGLVVGWKEDGIFQNLQEVNDSKFYSGQPAAVINRMPGEIRYKDMNGDHVIDNSDRTVIGNVNPKYFYGFSSTLSYNNIDFSLFFQGVQGGDIINTLKYITDNLGNNANTTVDAYNKRWTGEGSKGTNPKAILHSWRDFKFSDRYVEDGSYLRLKSVNIGYTFNLKSHAVVSNLRAFASITNLLTFTRYSGYDPEVNGFGQDPSRRGVDLGNYPNARTFTLGVNCTF